MSLLPREQYLQHGPEGAGDVDLLTLVLGTGAAGRSARAIALDLLERHGGLVALANTEPAALATVRGVGLARAVRIHAALELGRRRATARPMDQDVVDGPAAAARILVPPLRGLDREELHGLYLDRRRRPVARRCLSQGGERATVVDPRRVFRLALELRASAVVLAHNHPSGLAEPSMEDERSTRELLTAGRAVGVEVVDHLVVGQEGWTSMAERGVLPR